MNANAQDWYGGGWMQMYASGKKFFPLDPRAIDVHIEDIAHNLSMLCRYVGNCREFYSVAQHCCIVSDWMLSYKLEGLLHDAAEAYIGDQSRPVKHSEPMRPFRAIEHRIENVISDVFDLDQSVEVARLVKYYDNRVLFTEKKFLLRDNGELWSSPVEPLPVGCIDPWGPTQAENEFLDRFYQLQKARISL